ncbi:WD40-repeat-containing domain protein [Trichoderma austrokoningii]
MRRWNPFNKRLKEVAGDRSATSSKQTLTQSKDRVPGNGDPADTVQQVQQVQRNTQTPPRHTTEQRALPTPAVSEVSTTIVQRAQGAVGDQTAGATEIDTEATSAETFLWDRAYDALRMEKDNPIIDYEALLSGALKVLAKETTSPIQIEDESDIADTIPADPIARRRLLKTVADLGLKHMEEKKISTTVLGHEIKLQDAVANVAKAVEWVEDNVKDAVKDSPYALIVMAGISLVLPLLKNPAADEAENQDGFSHITSQMRYYVTLEGLLLPEHFGADQNAELVLRLVDLYKLIIDFQVRSILRLYRSRTKNFWRGSVKYDSWGQKVEDIQKADKDFVQKLKTAISGSSLQKLTNLVQSTEASHKHLDNLVDISRNSMRYIEQIDQRMSDAENNACLGSLGVKPRHHKMRIEGDKGGLLRDSYYWILSHDDFKEWRKSKQGGLLWIKGDPGKGKTMLLCGVIDELIKTTAHTANISFFFCQADHSDINQAAAVLRGLIYMVVKQQPCLISYLRDAWDDGKDVFTSINAWVVLSEIFDKILGDTRLRSTHFIIDALDECTVNLNLLLDFIVEKSSSYPHVKWIVSSRDWLIIREHLGNAGKKTILSLELNKDTISAAVTTYINHKVSQLAAKKKYDNKTQQVVYNYLLSNANDTFLWVALVCEQLNKTLARNTRSQLEAFPPELDSLYQRMMDQIGELKEANLCRRILAIVTVVFEPLTLEELSVFVEPDDEDLTEIVALCGSFLTISNRVVSLVHKSAEDFLLGEEQKKIIFPSGTEHVHHLIFQRSMQVMSETLKRDIYQLGDPGYPIDQAQPPNPDPLVAVRYSSIYWVDHLDDCRRSQNMKEELQDNTALDNFLGQKYLYWLEALSLLRSMSHGMLSMTKLEALFEGQKSELADIVKDGRRFIQYCKAIAESHPLQIYSSALVFSPSKCLTRIRLRREEPEWLITKPIMEENWSACLQTFEGHSRSVCSVAWSPNGQRIASASVDNTIKIWRLGTGQCETLVGHDESVWSVTWSPDGQRVASASSDKTLKIWNLAMGQCKTLTDHNSQFTSVAWSPDGQQIASVSSSDNQSVKIWNPDTGQCKTLTVHNSSEQETVVAWSPDGQRIALASHRSSIDIWHLATGQCKTLINPKEFVESVVWSPDGQQIASASRSAVKIWDLATGQCTQTLPGHISVSWAPNGQQVAAVSSDKDVTVWDLATSQSNTMSGHSKPVYSVAWSPDGQRVASASGDETIKIWDPAVVQYKSSTNHAGGVTAIEWSPDNQQFASASSDKTVKIWDLAMRHCITLTGHRSMVQKMSWSPDGQQIASGSSDDIKIWDPATGQCKETLVEIAYNLPGSIAWAPDGQQIVLTNLYGSTKIWHLATGQCNVAGFEWTSSATWSPDGQKIASTSVETTIEIWDTATGQHNTLTGHDDEVLLVAWSPGGQQIASASDDQTVKIWDAATGQCQATLPIYTRSLRFVTSETLRIDAGEFNLPSLVSMNPGLLHGPDVLLSQASGCGFDETKSWILYRGRKLLWLPTEFRSEVSAVNGTTVGIGCSSGRILVMKFLDGISTEYFPSCISS